MHPGPTGETTRPSRVTSCTATGFIHVRHALSLLVLSGRLFLTELPVTAGPIWPGELVSDSGWVRWSHRMREPNRPESPDVRGRVSASANVSTPNAGPSQPRSEDWIQVRGKGLLHPSWGTRRRTLSPRLCERSFCGCWDFDPSSLGLPRVGYRAEQRRNRQHPLELGCPWPSCPDPSGAGRPLTPLPRQSRVERVLLCKCLGAGS
jgi:hypothetical protein